MRLRVLVIPDKFKGTLSAQQAADAIARGWTRARPQDDLDLLPMSDGGDGFGEVMSGLIRAVPMRVTTCDAAHRTCSVRWWWQPGSKTAILDTAAVVGLAMLPPGRHHPFGLDTYGLGKVLKRSSELGARHWLIGLGGSATNDAGFGLARALGWQFLDAQGQVIRHWTDLHLLKELHLPARGLKFPDVVGAVDVQNPLLGPRGASRVYGPQKGLKPKDFPIAEKALRRVAMVVKEMRGSDLGQAPGAGAAGGLGFAVLAFLGGRLKPGFELFAHQANLEKALRRADLVLTGEGAIDRSTFMGKGAGCVAKMCAEMRVPCIGFSGMLARGIATKRLFTRIRVLTELATLARAKAEPGPWLEKLARQTAVEWPVLLSRSPARKVRSRDVAEATLKVVLPKSLNSSQRGVPSAR